METTIEKSFLNEVAEKLELPDSAYEKAEVRYKDLGSWLCRDNSSCRGFSPHIFSQGSFRLGTANRPLNSKEEYDLDLACNLEEGISKLSYSQAELKNLLGNELELYRIARGIKEELEEKKRCWRLEYADEIKFHMDIVPSIPESEDQRRIIKKSILYESNNEFLADSVSELTVSITDNTHPDYFKISNNWNISNPEGYTRWFESRMKLAYQLLEERAKLLKSATIDKIPNYKWKTPLQMCVQLLKRHRDIMFEGDPDIKPISIIITTLTARAYQGENDLESTVLSVLGKIGSLVYSKSPRVPNPVNPSEDFTDKWNTKEGRELRLEENFWKWLTQAQIDFDKMCSSQNADYLAEQSIEKFAIKMDKTELAKKLDISYSSINIVAPKHHEITEKPKPWQEK
jgi:hypothetical protein